MKTKEFISITLKIIGLIAFWRSILAFGAMINGIGIFFSLFANNDQVNNSYLITIGLAMILNFVLPLIVGIIFLFRTEHILSIIKVSEQSQIDLPIDKLTLYHMMIIIFGFTIILHGAGSLLNFNYKTDTKTEYISNYSISSDQEKNRTSQEKVTVTHSKSKNVNYVALIEVIMGIVLLTNATEISRRIKTNFDTKTAKLPGDMNR